MVKIMVMLMYSWVNPEISAAMSRIRTRGFLKFLRNCVRAECFFPLASSFGP